MGHWLPLLEIQQDLPKYFSIHDAMYVSFSGQFRMMIALTQQIRDRSIRQDTYSVAFSSIGWSKPVVAFGSGKEDAMRQILEDSSSSQPYWIG